MKIAITGGAGYIGCRLSEQLLNNGHEVVCIDWLKYGVQPILNILDRKGFYLHKTDICSPDIFAIIEDCDAVIHLAGIVGFPACQAEPDLAFKVNVEGTQNVINASKGKKFVYASTGSVYGELGTICDETCDTNPISTYSVYKLAGERMLEGTDAVILRPATAFGVSNRLRQDLLVNDFTYKAIAEKQLVLFEGHFKRTFISINDLARSFRWGVERFDDMKGQVWNVGDERLNHTKLDIANIIKSKVDYKLEVNTDLAHDQDGRNYFVDYTKIRQLGFEAKETLEDGIDNLVKLYQAT
ncbi:NAD(P)-dependent oxidoreductase [bacterium]|nr:NAD(P)-dependent oxidoreductase [bacterium]